LPVPSTVDPSLKVTISPLGGCPSEELTTAVKVTACPYVEGFTEEERVVVVEVSVLALEADASSIMSVKLQILMQCFPFAGCVPSQATTFDL